MKHQWDLEPWSRTMELIEAEWAHLKGFAAAAEAALNVDEAPD